MKNKFGIVFTTISAIVIPAYIIYSVYLVYYYFADTIAFISFPNIRNPSKEVTFFEMMTNNYDYTIIIPLLIGLLFFILGKRIITSHSLFRKIMIRFSITIFSLWIIAEILLRIGLYKL